MEIQNLRESILYENLHLPLKKERKSEKEGRKTKTRKIMAIEESSEDNEGRILENEGRIVHWVRRIEDSNNKLE